MVHFAAQVLFEPSIRQLIDTYLRYVRRKHDLAHGSLEEGTGTDEATKELEVSYGERS